MPRDWPHLPNAPITEALIDIRAELPPHISIDDLSNMRELVKDNYPTVKKRRTLEASFQFHEEADPEQKIQYSRDGFLFWSADERQVVQSRMDGFTFSRLKPYERWANLRTEGRRLWDLYVQTTQPLRVTRIALRYIDRIELPLPFSDFREWLVTIPQVAPTLPNRLAGFLMRLVIPFGDGGITALVTQSLEVGAHKNSLPLILDIDVSIAKTYAVGSEEMWETLEELRDVKNQVFFDSITRKTEELFR